MYSDADASTLTARVIGAGKRSGGGRMKVLAVIEQPDVVTKILDHPGMPTVPESIAPARVPPRQLDFKIDAV